MDITVKNEDILTALNLVRPAIDDKAGFESSHVYLKAVNIDNKGWLYLYCSNFFSQVITKIEVTIKEAGEILIPPHKLIDTLRTAGKELFINISTPDLSKVKIKTVGKGFSFHLSCHSNVNQTSTRVRSLFPLKEPVSAIIELPILMEFYKRTQFCTLNQTVANSHLDAIQLVIDKSTCVASATDRTIAVQVTRVQESTKEKISILLSKDEYGLLSKVFSDQKDASIAITIDPTKGSVFFSSNSTIYGARILAGGFPDITRLLKTEPEFKFHVSKHELLAVAQRARIFANDNRIVRILATKGRIELTVGALKGKDGSDFTEGVELLPGSEISGLPEEGKEVYVGIDYVINVLSTSSSSEIILGMFALPATPIRFHEVATEETKNTKVDYIMMGRSKW